jgi:ribosomal protein L37AE/L43A
VKNRRTKPKTKPTKPAKCPKCGSARVVPILYGEPIPRAAAMARRGQLAIGGCCVFEGQPEWQCRNCEHEWSDPDHPARTELERLFTGAAQDEG